MGDYEAMYHTPLGFKIVRFQAEGMDEAMRAAEARCRFGVVELVWLRGSGSEAVRDEGAEEGGDEPACLPRTWRLRRGSANRVSGR